jgi:uncharacterized repeat protein (TIGR01451 family)
MNSILKSISILTVFFAIFSVNQSIVLAGSEPDVTITKSNDTTTGIVLLGDTFKWNLTFDYSDNGNFDGFITNDVLILDNLPSGPTYGTPSVTFANGDFNASDITCSITTNDLTCIANTNINLFQVSSFQVRFDVTPNSTGSLGNPRTTGVCKADPDNWIDEFDEFNNDCSNSVTVTAVDLTVSSKTNDTGMGILSGGSSLKWTITITNQGNTTASFAVGEVVFSDNLPNVGAIVSAVFNSTIDTTGTITCTTTNPVTCSADAGGFSLPGSNGNFSIDITVTVPLVGGIIINPTGGSCRVDPNNEIGETNDESNGTDNNDCPPDPVTISTTDLLVNKFNTVGGTTFFTNSFNWFIDITSNGTNSSLFTAGQRLFEDQLPTDATYDTLVVSPNGFVNSANGLSISGSFVCSIDVNSFLTCDAGAAGLGMPPGSVIHVQFVVTPIITSGLLTNPDGGICRVDPQNLIDEINDELKGTDNNNCSDSVLVSPPLSKLADPETINLINSFNIPFWCGERKDEFTMDGTTFVNVERFATEIEVIFPQKRILLIFPGPQETANLVESATLTEPSNFLTPGSMSIPFKNSINSGKTIQLGCNEINTFPTRLDDSGDLDQFLSQVLQGFGYYHGVLTLETDKRDLKVFVTKMVHSSKCVNEGSGLDCVESQTDMERKEISSTSISLRRTVTFSVQKGPVTAAAEKVAPAVSIRDLSTVTKILSSNQRIEFRAHHALAQEIDVDIYSLNGRKVFSQSSRGHSLQWNLRDDSGRRVANGVYLYRVVARGSDRQVMRSEIKKFVVLR